MRPAAHLVFGTIGGGAVYLASGSPLAGAAFTATHILTDLDHIPDYLIWTTNPRQIGRFLKPDDWGEMSRIVLFLHAFEWLVLMAVLLAAFPSWELAATTLGFGAHLIMDFFGNRCCKSPLFYFIVYRIIRGFKYSYLIDRSR